MASATCGVGRELADTIVVMHRELRPRTTVPQPLRTVRSAQQAVIVFISKEERSGCLQRPS